MRVRTLTGGLAAVLVLSGPLLNGPAVAVAPVAPAGTAQRQAADDVVTYDASGAAEFRAAVERGAAIWNESVETVELCPAASGQRADVRIVADDGWPRSVPTSMGDGTVYIGRQAVDRGYSPIRIAAHELGHMLGLPDRKPGPCSSLMSGASAGTSCTNPYPSAAEKAQVERNFEGAPTGALLGRM
ncbi:peptidase [Streptomyces sp. 13-12-16]|uniref:snapalysin family zinc-dependent metalloprotease n=1 Tax=Streptomyces sp. 13-12-16 TaxID=1570823 RepID=UPI000A1F151C|nr:snapalysin family zinc-dependent metalloprotease [Streptomyces sp. 13-12-16]OSP39869.1 peptidase [Streptomyces sp. 13-12-16]